MKSTRDTAMRWAAAAILALGAAACTTARDGEPAYDLAQGCFAVQADRNGLFLAATGPDGYAFSAKDASEAAAFFFKPTGLGTFLLYDQDGGYLGVVERDVARRREAGPASEWGVKSLKILLGKIPIGEKSTLVSTLLDHRLLVGEGKPILGRRHEPSVAAAAALNLVERPAEACRAFPEAALDAEVSAGFSAAQDPMGPVVGWADLHAHLSFVKSMGGVVMAGESFDRFGIEKALPDCARLHGPGGTEDLVGITVGLGPHATGGYPEFPSWPSRGAATHSQTYYRWIQRAYLSGLRLVVADPTGDRILCQLVGLFHLTELEGDCTPASTVELQIRFLRDLEAYIDAQEGGPGKGWFRIVTSPAEARAVIAENKLAVVLGMEYGLLFDCREGQEKCDEAYVDAELDRLHDLGVRSIFPIHRFDNAFGGTRPGGEWLNFGSKMNTGEIDHLLDLINPWGLLFKPIGGHFFDLEACPPGARGDTGTKDLRRFVRGALPIDDPTLRDIVDAVLIDKLEPIPDYAGLTHGEAACNARGLQPIGRYLIERMMDRGMILELDHMSFPTLEESLAMAEARGYSGVVSSHSWLAGDDSYRQRIFALGGLVVPINQSATRFGEIVSEYSHEMSAYPYTVGVGIGTDIQGMTGQTNARPEFPVDYPFTSYDGLVTFTPPKTGERAFDFMREGVAHYGLLAEWVEQIRQYDERDPDDIMRIFMNSAEAYIEMWERARAGAL
ncbi:MAG: hypothetical protein KC466_04745 [Myxococcales bacterium]|nr:hypothetical protein [Myxococcales bacterium]